MTTLTSSGTFAVGAGAIATLTAAVTVIPSVGTGQGRGRLIHPSLGTYDYIRGPDEWANIDTDAIIAPIWSSTKTLLGAANTLFLGDIRDVIVEERWIQSTAMELSQARMLIAMWQTPPDPTVAYVQWFPTYSNDLGYNVVILGLSAGGSESGVTLNPLVKNGIGWAKGPIVLKMRIAGRV